MDLDVDNSNAPHRRRRRRLDRPRPDRQASAIGDFQASAEGVAIVRRLRRWTRRPRRRRRPEDQRRRDARAQHGPTRGAFGFDPASTSSHSGPVYQIALGLQAARRGSVAFVGPRHAPAARSTITIRNGTFELYFDVTIVARPGLAEGHRLRRRLRADGSATRRHRAAPRASRSTSTCSRSSRSRAPASCASTPPTSPATPAACSIGAQLLPPAASPASSILLEIFKLNASFMMAVGGGRVNVGRGYTAHDARPRPGRVGHRRSARRSDFFGLASMSATAGSPPTATSRCTLQRRDRARLARVRHRRRLRRRREAADQDDDDPGDASSASA